jgi:hypothetical protein
LPITSFDFGIIGNDDRLANEEKIRSYKSQDPVSNSNIGSFDVFS